MKVEPWLNTLAFLALMYCTIHHCCLWMNNIVSMLLLHLWYLWQKRTKRTISRHHAPDVIESHYQRYYCGTTVVLLFCFFIYKLCFQKRLVKNTIKHQIFYRTIDKESDTFYPRMGFVLGWWHSCSTRCLKKRNIKKVMIITIKLSVNVKIMFLWNRKISKVNALLILQ